MGKTLQNYYNTSRFTDTKKYVDINKYLRTGLKNPYLNTEEDNNLPRKTNNESSYVPIKENRGFIDRLFDVLSIGNYTLAGGVKSSMQGKGFGRGVWEGLKASNPFGEGYNKGEVTWSNVLELGGWDRGGTGSKIGRGVAGFILDVLLDPITYVSFGGGAILKGTGKAALGATHGSVIRKMSDEFGVDISKGMTEEAAKKIILKQSFKHNRNIPDELIDQEAKRLVNRFNKVIGVRETPRDVTLSLKNMPFGEKVFPNARALKLVDAKTLQKLGDKRIAPAYSKMRDKIYGSVLGKNFSTIAPLYHLSKTNPEAFYDFIRHIDDVHGMNADRLTKNKMIYEYAKELKGLTPAENKQLIELLEDSSKWHYSTKMFNYLDTKAGQRKHLELAAKIEEETRKIEMLTKQKNTIQRMIDDAEGSIDELNETFNKLEKEYHEELFKIDIKNIEDKATVDKYVKMIQDEIDRISAKKEEIVSKVSSRPVDEKSVIYDAAIKERAERVATLKTEAKNLRGEIKKLSKEENKLLRVLGKEKVAKNSQISEKVKRIDEIKKEIAKLESEDYSAIHKPFIDEWNEIKANKITQTKNEQRVSMIEYARKLSHHLTGNKNAISFRTDEKNINVIIHLMEIGTPQEKILKFIEDNNKYFDGTYPEMYSWIAKQLDYDVWQKKYWNEKKDIMADILKKGQVTPHDRERLNKLEVLRSKRDFLIAKLDSCKDSTELMEMITEFEDMMLMSNRKDAIFKDMKMKEVEKLSKATTLGEITDLPPQKIIDDMLEELKYTPDEIKKMIKDARREARENGASKYQQDKISKEIKNTYGKEKKYKSVDEALSAYDEMRKSRKQSGYVEDTYTPIVKSMIDAEQLKKDKELVNNKLTAMDKDDMRDTLIQFLKKGEYIKYKKGEKEVVKIKVPKAERSYKMFIKSITNEIFELSKVFQWTDMYGEAKPMHWSLLSDGQKELLTNIALNNYYRGTMSTKDKVFDAVKKSVREELKLRNERERVSHIIDNINVGDKVEVKLSSSDDLVEVNITDYRMNDKTGAQIFEYKGINQVDGSEITFYPDDVVNILELATPKDIEGLIKQSGVIKSTMQRADELKEEVEKLEDEIKNVASAIDDKISGVIEKYAKSKEEIEAQRNKLLEEMKELRRLNKNDKAKLKRIDARQVKEVKKLTDDINAKESEILEKQKEIIKLQTNEKYNQSIRQQKANELKKALDERAVLIANKIEKYEKRVVEYSEKLKRAEFEKLDEMIKNVQDMEKALESDEFFDTYMRSQLGDKKVDKAILKEKFDVVDVVLNDDVDIEDKIREIANYLRSEMLGWGREEVSINKLKRAQLYANMKNYLPHILTPEGETLITSRVSKSVPQFGQDYGYGRVFNQFGKSRKFVIKNADGTINMKPTIEEANKHLNEMVNSDKVFSDIVADIYLARGIKHNDLMYDDSYMRSMLEIFGEELINETGVKAGYKAVMNFGMTKDSMRDMSRFKVRTEISNAVNEYLKDANVISKVKEVVERKINKFSFNSIAEYNYQYKKMFAEELSSVSSKFVKKNFPQEKQAEMFQEYLEEVIDSSMMRSSIEDIATPMLEISDEQVSALRNTRWKVQYDYLNTVRRSMMNFENNYHYSKDGKGIDEKIVKMIEIETDGLAPNELKKYYQKRYEHYDFDDFDKARFDSLIGKIDEADKISLQIKQVNEAIVEKANRTRKVQIAKDNSRMLQLWDKVTHLIKLNQTTIMPAFHMRNKYSNTFNNWLTIGLDATNMKLQKESAMTMYYKRMGDTSKLDGLVVDVNGKEMDWEELYDMAMEYNVIDEGFFGKDLGSGFDSGLVGKYINPKYAKYDPTDAKNFVWYKKGAEVGSLIEGQDRLLHFVAVLRQGKTPREAAESVERALFDYSDLTAFERNVMKRILPYYTWLRKNAALQLEMMLENPKKYMNISKIVHGVEGMVDEEDEINKALVNDFAKNWVQTPFKVMNPQGREEVVLWNPNLPYLDLDRIPDPTNISESAKELFTQMNPMIRVPIEQAKNYNYFFESPIVDEGDSQARRIEHVLNNTALYNVGTGALKKKDLDLALHAVNATSGVKFLSYDYDAYKYKKLEELKEKYQKKNKKKEDN